MGIAPSVRFELPSSGDEGGRAEETDPASQICIDLSLTNKLEQYTQPDGRRASGGCSVSRSHLNDDGVKQSLIWKLLTKGSLPLRHEHL